MDLIHDSAAILFVCLVTECEPFELAVVVATDPTIIVSADYL